MTFAALPSIAKLCNFFLQSFAKLCNLWNLAHILRIHFLFSSSAKSSANERCSSLCTVCSKASSIFAGCAVCLASSDALLAFFLGDRDSSPLPFRLRCFCFFL